MYVCVCCALACACLRVCVCVCVCFVVFFKKYTYTIIISKTSIRIIELPLSAHMITLMITLPMFETGQISGLNARSPFNQYYYVHRYIYITRSFTSTEVNLNSMWSPILLFSNRHNLMTLSSFTHPLLLDTH